MKTAIELLTGMAKPLTSKEGHTILLRDHYRCQYCGLDGLASFENALIMTVDFIHPRIRRGKKDPSNLVAACRPCNVIKGERVFSGFDAAKAYVLKRRESLRKEWEAVLPKRRAGAAT
jgi:5-methylcytosine-specific restriction endonuclease McrA